MAETEWTHYKDNIYAYKIVYIAKSPKSDTSTL